MNLYFLRHAPAESPEHWLGDDDARPLTAAGEVRMLQVGRALRRLSLDLEHIVTSPLPRAEQTARIVASELRLTERVTTSTLLAPGFDLEALLQLLSTYSHVEQLMLIGHEPDFSSVAGTIVGGSRLVLKKAGLCLVEVRSSSSPIGTLRWLLPPKVLVELGRSRGSEVDRS